MGNISFLIADDDADDAQFVREALQNVNSEIICHCVSDGEEMFRVLESMDQIPKVIFLDINMPGMDGWQCLTSLKNNSSYKNIPVLMYSTSNLAKDIDRALYLGASGFIVKPSSFKKIEKLMEQIYDKTRSNNMDQIARIEGVISGISTVAG